MSLSLPAPRILAPKKAFHHFLCPRSRPLPQSPRFEPVEHQMARLVARAPSTISNRTFASHRIASRCRLAALASPGFDGMIHCAPTALDCSSRMFAVALPVRRLVNSLAAFCTASTRLVRCSLSTFRPSLPRRTYALGLGSPRFGDRTRTLGLASLPSHPPNPHPPPPPLIVWSADRQPTLSSRLSFPGFAALPLSASPLASSSCLRRHPCLGPPKVSPASPLATRLSLRPFAAEP